MVRGHLLVRRNVDELSCLAKAASGRFAMRHTVGMTFIRSPEHGAVCTLLWFLPVLATGSTPVPTYGTYFGGTGDTNVAVAVAVDPSGNIVVAGYTTSQTLP